MKKYLCIALIGVLMITYGCDKDCEPTHISDKSFLPMQIGNYWKNNEENFIEITDTLKIQGDLYYKFHSLSGGDVIGTQYLRIDVEQNLIERYPSYPDSKYLHAKFNAQMGSSFWTINDQSVNDYEATVTEKEATKRTFEYYNPIFKNKYSVTFIKGLGWNDYKEIKISGELFKF